MPNYKYVAIDASGKSTKGEIVSINKEDLAQKLRDMQLELLSFKEVSAAYSKVSGGKGKIKSKDLIFILSSLKEMDSVGVPIIEALEDIRSAPNKKHITAVLNGLHDAVKTGKVLSEAFALYPNIFDDIFVGLISVGEKTGKISESLVIIIDYIKWQINLKSRIKKATTQPVFGILTMFAIVIVMAKLVVPKMTAFLIAQDMKLPLQTKMLMSFSDFVQKFWALFVAMPFIIVFGYKLSSLNKRAVHFVDLIKLKIPIINQLIIKIDVARFCNLFSVMYNSGLIITSAIEQGGKVVGNTIIKEQIFQVSTKVKGGMQLYAALDQMPLMPPLVRRMFKIGEMSGNMTNALNNVKFFFDQEIEKTIDSLVAALKPVLMVVTALLLTWIASAVFGPIYGNFAKMQF